MSVMLKDIPDGETAPMGFLVTLRRFFVTGRYSDMKIKDSNDHVYNVHKIVVCSQSEFFANAFKENTFKESKDNLIHLPDDDPAAVRAMLQFMYTGTYDNPVFFGSVDDMLLVHLQVYLIADKYRVGELILPNNNKKQPQPQPDANATKPSSSSGAGAGAAAADGVMASIYANIKRKSLGGLACARLHDDLLELWPLVQPVFPRLVKAVYDATAAKDDMIRGDVAAVAAKHVGAFLDDDEGGDDEDGSIEAAMMQAAAADGYDESEGEPKAVDVMGAFGRDLCKILVRERDELSERLTAYAGAAAGEGDSDSE